ncbi:MAG: UDP binding domain-containing protein [Polyangiales bacterium]
MKYNAQFIELADTVNSGMPGYVVTRVADLLNDQGKSVKNAKVLVVGVAYKRDVSDMRESPAIDVIELLHQKGAHVDYVDPWVPVFREGDVDLKSQPKDVDGSKYDIAVIVTDHTEFDYARLISQVPMTLDTRAVTRRIKDLPKGKVVRL